MGPMCGAKLGNSIKRGMNSSQPRKKEEKEIHLKVGPTLGMNPKVQAQGGGAQAC